MTDSILKSDLKELELNALLEITQAINDNMAEESLYRIYRFTLLANLKIKKLALFVNEINWDCKVSFGVKPDFSTFTLPEEYHNLDGTQLLGVSENPFEEFDIVFPVLHKGRVLAVVFIGEISNPEVSVGTNTTFLKALTNIIMVAIENKKLARKQLEQEVYHKELEIAKQVQLLLFPKELPNTNNLKIAAFYQPHHDVSGDYYDYIPLNKDKFIVCIADVSGKGVPAAIWMSNFQASLRTLVRQTDNLIDIVRELNYHVKGGGNRDMFITLFIACYDFSKNELRYINSGHNPPILINNGQMETLQTGSTILGVFEPLPFLEEGVLIDLNDFLLFCYTDGVTETFDENEAEFGMNKLLEVISENQKDELDEMNHKLVESLNAFRGSIPHNDDITILSCRVKN
ncbi:MAG: PP2C family protein-serine/threonine phosphatase [Bacteroidetes bacterium]|nr:PP2C family protein-serine/threonine phosphatase [Bacteroidota bacterium]MDA1120639.1 PP2C family protein-serine/threonine phosphatase [Bacteroidota bacterium]